MAAILNLSSAFRRLDLPNRAHALRLILALPNWAGSVPERITFALSHPDQQAIGVAPDNRPHPYDGTGHYLPGEAH